MATYYAIQGRGSDGQFTTDPVELSIGDRGTNEFETRVEAEQTISALGLGPEFDVVELDEQTHPRSGSVGLTRD